MKKSIILINVLFYCMQAMGQLPVGYKVYYPFSGNYNDTSGNHINATGINTMLVPDRHNHPNSACYFNGTDAYIQSQYMPQGLTGYTFCAWIKTDAVYTGNAVTRQISSFRGNGLNNARGLELEYYEYDGRFTWGLGGDYLWTARSLAYNNNNQWMHIACVWSPGTAGTFDTTQFRFYINGVLQNTIANYYNPYNQQPSPIPFSAINEMRLGSIASNLWFKGSMDEVIIYEKALNPAQIDSVMNAPSLGVGDINSSPGVFSLSPNPATDYITLSGNGNKGETEIELLNTAGQCIKRLGKHVINASSPFQTDISELSAGIYFLKITDDMGGSKLLKLVKR